MTENATGTISAPSTQEIVELDLKDLLAELLLHWKQIMIWVLAAAVLGACFPFIKKALGPKEITPEKIAEAREKLAEPEAQETESLFFQYTAYKALQQDTAEYYTRLTTVPMEEGAAVEMRSKYLVFSSLDNLADSVIDSALTEADYDAMRAILPDEEIGLRIYDRVRITCDGNNSITTTAESAASSKDKVNNVFVSVQKDARDSLNQFLFTVDLYGRNEAECEEMMKVADAALQKNFQSLQALDPGFSVSFVGCEFDYNVFEQLNMLRKKNIDRIAVTTEELADLANRTDQLSADQKDYYKILKEQYEQQFPRKIKTSILKTVVIPAFLGGVLAVLFFSCRYLFDGTAKTAGELEYSFQTAVLSRIFVQDKKNLFGTWCASLCGVDGIEPAKKIELLATDLDIMMTKSGKKVLYLLCSEATPVSADLAEKVRSRLLQMQPEAVISVGNPLTSMEEMKKAGTAELGIVFAELKHSKRSVLRQWKQLCSRYHLQLAGAVSVRRCWI